MWLYIPNKAKTMNTTTMRVFGARKEYGYIEMTNEQLDRLANATPSFDGMYIANEVLTAEQMRDLGIKKNALIDAE